jgi:hypothetical protein
MGIIRKDFRYKVIKNILSQDERELLKHYFRLRHRSNKHFFDDLIINKTSPNFYADPLTEALLLSKQKIIEENCGLELFPTYSFWRMYTWGSSLHKHKDRDSCEISCTIAVDSDSNEPWPIIIEGKEVNLNLGDGVIYLGIEDSHERKELFRDYYSQCFLHYVDKNGPYVNNKLDKRNRLGASK